MAFEFFMSVMRSPLAYTKVRNKSAVRRAMLDYKAAHPACEACGRTKGVEVHHIIPVSVAPSVAGHKHNFISLGRPCRCHQVHGHNGDFSRRYVPNVRELIKNIQSIQVVETHD